jgi:hypothetical protein
VVMMGMVGGSCLLAGVYSLGMLVGMGEVVGGKVGRRGELRSLSSRQSRADFGEARGAVLLSVYEDYEFWEKEKDDGSRLVVIPPCETPISRLSDVEPPYTASKPVESLTSRVKFPKPRLLMVTSNTSDPPLGPGTT